MGVLLNSSPSSSPLYLFLMSLKNKLLLFLNKLDGRQTAPLETDPHSAYFWKIHLIPRRFHVNGPRKKVTVEKWIFLNEMWKIIEKIDDFDRFLTTFVILGGVFSQKSKIPKKYCFGKVKIQENYFFLRLSHLFQISCISFL